ncbi:putative tRNA splicing endonuclease, partial [Toxoplasma gondii FOU]
VEALLSTSLTAVGFLFSRFFPGLVERVDDSVSSVSDFTARGKGSETGDTADRSAIEKSGGGQFILRLPHLVSGDLSQPSALSRHQMHRMPLEQVAVNTSWIAVSLTQLTTAVREIQTVFLSQLSPHFPFLLNPLSLHLSPSDPTLSASSSSSSPLPPSLPSSASLASRRSAREAALAGAWFKQAVDRELSRGVLNASQAEAIRDVLTTETKLGLIQGPPGTGKTQAICSLLAILYSRLRDQQRLRDKEPSVESVVPRFLDSPSASLASRRQHEAGRSFADQPTPACSGLKKKILVCAPSNAAVDELAERLMTRGLAHPMTGEVFRPACLRIGNLDRVRESVLPITLDAQVKRLRGRYECQMEAAFQVSLQELREKKKSLVQQHQCVRVLLSRGPALDGARLNSPDGVDDLVAAMLSSSTSSFAASFSGEEGKKTLRELLPALACLSRFDLKDLRATLDAQLEDVNSRLSCLFEARRQDRLALSPACRHQVVLNSDIVFATLSASAHELLCPYTLATQAAAGLAHASSRGGAAALASLSPSLPGLSTPQEQKASFLQAQFFAARPAFSYAYLVVDEAGQASELSCLIPLRLAPERCILVGDPQQLPSTVFSSLAEKRGLGRSLLERLALCAAEDNKRREGRRGSTDSREGEKKNRGQEKTKTGVEEGGLEEKGEERENAEREGRGQTRKDGGSKSREEGLEDPLGDEEERKRLKSGVSLALGTTNLSRTTRNLKVNLLTTQYRMREEIARFPSEAFYDGRLETSPSVLLRPRLPCFRLHWLFAPLKFFRVPSVEDRGNARSSSLANYEEARFVIGLLRILYIHFCDGPHSTSSSEREKRNLGCSSGSSLPLHSSASSPGSSSTSTSTSSSKSSATSSSKSSSCCAASASRSSVSSSPVRQKLCDVGVVTPYRQQVSLLQQLIAEDPVLSLARERPEINTVDAFQGREKSIIIISFVRASGAAALAAQAVDSRDARGRSEKGRSQRETGNDAGTELTKQRGNEKGSEIGKRRGDEAGKEAEERGRGVRKASLPPRVSVEAPNAAVARAASPTLSDPREGGLSDCSDPASSPSSACATAFSTLGFVADFRRLNVALTRARDALWIVGDDETLETHSTFRRFLAYVRSLPGDAYVDLLNPPKPLRRLMDRRGRESAAKCRRLDTPRACVGGRGAGKLSREEEGLLFEFFGAVEEDFRCSRSTAENDDGERRLPRGGREHATVFQASRERAQLSAETRGTRAEGADLRMEEQLRDEKKRKTSGDAVRRVRPPHPSRR